MSLLFFDGFDHYATADFSKKWTAIDGGSVIGSSLTRRAGSSYLLAATNDGLRKTLAASSASFVIGMAYRCSSMPSSTMSVFTFYDSGTAQINLSVNVSGFLEVRRGAYNGTLLGTSSAGISAGAWNYIEAKFTISDTVGAVTVKINGTTVLTLTGMDTKVSANASANEFRIANSGVITSQYFDDLYLCDTAGAAPNNDFLGDCRIDALYPNADGSNSAWTPSTGTTHYTLVDEATPNTTDYVESATIGAKDTWNFQDLATITGTIYGAQLCSAVLKADAGARSIANTVKSGATNADGASKALSTSQLYYLDIWPTDPNTAAAWTEANLNAAEFGIKVAA